MIKPKYNMKKVRKAYYINAQSGIVILVFLLIFTFVTGYIFISTMLDQDTIISIVMFLLCLLTGSITCFNFKFIIQTFVNRKKLFEEKVSEKMWLLLEEELADKQSQYFETICVGKQYMIHLNPEPYQDIFINKMKITEIQLKKIKTGIKYSYWTNQVTIVASGKIFKTQITNNQTMNRFISTVKQTLPTVTIKQRNK